jgi:hypothetical protein
MARRRGCWTVKIFVRVAVPVFVVTVITTRAGGHGDDDLSCGVRHDRRGRALELHGERVAETVASRLPQ